VGDDRSWHTDRVTSQPAPNVLIVGLGSVASSHLRALEQVPGATVAGGVDPAASGSPPTFHGGQVTVFPNLREAARQCRPTLVVVATPTRTHAAVCEDVCEYFPDAEVLVEKPATDDVVQARRLLGGSVTRRPVNVAYHMAFSPEVTWAAGVAAASADRLEPPTRITCWFADAYHANAADAVRRLGSSWLDSGINLLSVLSRFVTPIERRSLRQLGPPEHSAFEARIDCTTANGGALEALAVTTWFVTDASKTTRIQYASGDELVMDHTAVAGYLIRDGQIAEMFGSGGAVPRRDSHYMALYRWWLTEGRPLWPVEQSRILHEILLRPL
jgi:predicted dehydrogenase